MGAYLDFKTLYYSVPSLGQNLHAKTQKQSFFSILWNSYVWIALDVRKLKGWVNLANQDELQSPLKLSYPKLFNNN